jgi:antitoxin (DNA-binding transcriptional repressor) of toxin-antitoxin stability system
MHALVQRETEKAMIQVTTDEAKERLPDLMDAAARGETVLIEKEADQGAQIVQLVALPQQAHRKRKAGSAKGLIIHMAEDFDAPLEDFREYM